MNPSAEQTGLPEDLKIMPEYFKEAGYQTALSGKWHLGMHKEEYLPTNRGFDSSYGHMLGGIGYYDHVHTNRICLLYTSPSPRDATLSRMPSSA